MKLYELGVRLNVGKNYSSQRVINVWNDLPQCAMDSSPDSSFKNRLDKLWNDMLLRPSTCKYRVIVHCPSLQIPVHITDRKKAAGTTDV